LWLGSPSCDSNQLKDIGLTKLISNTINNCISRGKVFKELEENFNKYENITEDDIMWLSYAVAINSVNLMDIEEIDTFESDGFVDKIHEKIEYVKNVEDEVNKKQTELESTKLEHSTQLKKNHEIYENELKIQRSENKRIELKYGMERILSSNALEIERQKTLLNEKNREINIIKNSSEKQVVSVSILIFLGITVFLYFTSRYIIENWTDKNLEPVFTVMGSLILPFIFLISGYFFREKLDIIKLRDYLTNIRANSLLRKNNISRDELQDIEKKIKCLDLDISLCNTIFEDLDKDYNLIELNYTFNLNQNIDNFQELVNKIKVSA